MTSTAPLRRIAQIQYGDSLPEEQRQDGPVPVFGSAGRVGRHDLANTEGPVIVIGRKGSHGKISYSSEPVFAIDTTYFVDSSCTRANLRWLKYALEAVSLDRLSQDVGVPGLSREVAYGTRMPVISLEDQGRIADFLDYETAKLDDLTRLKQKLAANLPERLGAAMHAAIVELPRNARLGYVGSWFSGGTPPKDDPQHWSGSLPWVSTKDLATDDLHDTLDHITHEAAHTYSCVVPKGSVLVSTRGMALAKRLPLSVTRQVVAFNQDLKALVPAPGIEADYLRIVLRGYQSDLLAAVGESAHGTRRLETRHLKALRVPVADPGTQKRIVEEIREIEHKNLSAVTALRRQIDVLKERRAALIIAAVFGELETHSFPATVGQ